MVPLQYTNFGVFLVSFSIGSYTHNWLAGLGYVLLLLHSVFWVSDFTAAPIDTSLWFHVWTAGIALAAGVAGHLYAKAMACPQLIVLSTLRSLRDRVYIPMEDIFVFLFAVSTLLVAAGINFWLGRTIIGGGGLSPINADLISPGIGMTVAFGIMMVVLTIGLVATNYDGRVSLKYMWLAILPPLSLVLNDLAFFDWGLSDPWPALLSLGVLIVLQIVVWLLSVYLPVLRRGTQDLDDNTTRVFEPSEFDPLYKNSKYALAFFGGQLAIYVVGWLALNMITDWFGDRSLETGAIVMISTAGLVLIVALIIGYGASKQIAELRKVKVAEEGSLQHIFPERKYVTLKSERSVQSGAVSLKEYMSQGK
jgi:hypothetical protein